MSENRKEKSLENHKKSKVKFKATAELLENVSTRGGVFSKYADVSLIEDSSGWYSETIMNTGTQEYSIKSYDLDMVFEIKDTKDGTIQIIDLPLFKFCELMRAFQAMQKMRKKFGKNQMHSPNKIKNIKTSKCEDL